VSNHNRQGTVEIFRENLEFNCLTVKPSTCAPGQVRTQVAGILDE
jgi:hypothetical protein